MLKLSGSRRRLWDTLAPLGIYNLGEGTLNDAELSAYAAGLDRLFCRLEDIYRGNFIEFSESEALNRKLRLVGIGDCDGCTPGEKRDILMYGSRADANSPTLENFIGNLKSRGITATVAEDAANERLTMKITDVLGQFTGVMDIYFRMLDVLPCHLEVGCTVLYCTFDRHDGLEQSFDTIESLNQSFDQYADRFTQFWDLVY